MKYKKISFLKRQFKKAKKKRFKWYYIIIHILIFLVISIQLLLGIFRKKSFLFKQRFSDNNNNLNLWNYSDVLLNYFSKLPKKYQGEINHELWLYRKYMRLKNISKEGNSDSDQRAKMELYHNLGGKKYSQLKNIYIMDHWKFGNSMIMLNNMLYYFEMLRQKKNIYLNSAHHWFIKDKIVTEFVNISVVDNSTIDCNDNSTVCILRAPWILTPIVIMPEIRIKLLKPEIMKNLPKVSVNEKDLYIHIRSGDIFNKYYPHCSYPQPPLCFYKSIIDNKKFKKIYICSENKKNPVIGKLMEEYPKIIFHNGTLSDDIAVLINAYNLVGSVSSFIQICLILNDNIVNYYEYDIYRKIEKFRHLHHDVYKYPRSFNIYQMKPSEFYQGEMYFWANTKSQVKIMMNEYCDFNQFQLIKT